MLEVIELLLMWSTVCKVITQNKSTVIGTSIYFEIEPVNLNGEV